MSILREFSFKALCWTFCCPPCPARIMTKLAFHPPEPTYFFESKEGDPNLHIRIINFEHSCKIDPHYLDIMEAFTANTSRGNHICCVYIKCTTTSTKKTILYSHGNACDLGIIVPFFRHLSIRLKCNILGYDYTGYGQSSGKPSEKSMYLDIETAWKALQSRYGIGPKDIILYGQSIGTVPTVDLASKTEAAGVVLVAPLMSGLRVAFPTTRRTWCFDAFSSIDKVQKISSPLLVMHGTMDFVISVSHGRAISEKCKHSVEPLFIEGAGHNDVESEESSMKRLVKFVTEELSE